MKKRIYLSHPYGGFRENREKAAALTAFYRAVWDAEGMTDWEIINPIEYFAPVAESGVDDETILMMAVALMNDCDGVLFAPGWKKSRGCRYEHYRLRHAKGLVKYFKDEIPAEVAEAAAHWFGKHHHDKEAGGMSKLWNSLTEEGQGAFLIAGFVIEAYLLFWVMA